MPLAPPPQHSPDFGFNWKQWLRVVYDWITGNVTVEGDLTVEGAFTSIGIDDNADQTVLTLGADESATFAGDVEVSGYLTTATYTSTQLDDSTHAVNTGAGKVQGAMVYNTTTDNPVWAIGNADGDVWVDGAGTTVNNPV